MGEIIGKKICLNVLLFDDLSKCISFWEKIPKTVRSVLRQKKGADMRKSRMKKIMCVGTAILMAGVMSGCSVKVNTRKEPKLDAVVAHPTIGENTEEMNVTYEMFRKEYKFFLMSSGVEDDTEESVAVYCTAQRQSIINYLINEQLIIRKAKEMGLYDLTEEEQKEVDDNVAETINKQIDYYGSMAALELASDAEPMTDEEKKEAGSKKLDEILEECGMTRDDLHWWAQSSKITQKLQNVLYENVPYSKAEEQFKEDQKQAEELYKTDIMTYTMMGYDSKWLPEGSRLIKHILIGFDDETQKEISSLRSGGSDSDADKKRAEAADKLKEKQEEIEKKLEEGESIDELIKKYSADAQGSAAYPDGYTVIPNGVGYMEEFQKAAFVPAKIGDRTVCVTDYGVHIMVYAGDARISDESVKANTDYLYEQLKQKEFSDKMKEWAAEYAYDIDYGAVRLEAPEENSAAA